MEGVLFQTSLIAAFVAGVVALFAPCCISFLLPAYLGSVFKEKEKVLLMTLIFGLGIFVVMMPAILGIAVLSKALFVYHDEIYVVGGFVMLIAATITFLGLKFPMPNLPGRQPGKHDPLSIFILGIFSGITSACCAPVLIGILTLTFLTPSFFGALGIGATYVLGMVFPLLIISMFLSGKVDKFMILRKPITEFKFLGKNRVVLVSNFLASAIFFLTGILILSLNATGKLSMGNIDGFTKMITGAGNFVNQYVGNNVLLNLVFLLLIILFVFYILKKSRR